MVGRLPFLRNKNLSQSLIFLGKAILPGWMMDKAKALGEPFLAQTRQIHFFHLSKRAEMHPRTFGD
jgi:hypothetical protein